MDVVLFFLFLGFGSSGVGGFSGIGWRSRTAISILLVLGSDGWDASGVGFAAWAPTGCLLLAHLLRRKLLGFGQLAAAHAVGFFLQTGGGGLVSSEYVAHDGSGEGGRISYRGGLLLLVGLAGLVALVSAGHVGQWLRMRVGSRGLCLDSVFVLRRK